jgi:hypothetical protein
MILGNFCLKHFEKINAKILILARIGFFISLLWFVSIKKVVNDKKKQKTFLIVWFDVTKMGRLVLNGRVWSISGNATHVVGISGDVDVA